MKGITPFLWFDTEAEEAANFYVSAIPNSKLIGITRYGEAGPREAGTVMTVEFELDGQRLVALNGGPEYTFSGGVSFVLNCETQDEVDELWEKLGEGGQHHPCGWLTDKYGLTWQVVPTRLQELLSDPDPQKSQRVMAAMMQMGKLEIEPLERAAVGAGVAARS